MKVWKPLLVGWRQSTGVMGFAVWDKQKGHHTAGAGDQVAAEFVCVLRFRQVDSASLRRNRLSS